MQYFGAGEQSEPDCIKVSKIKIKDAVLWWSEVNLTQSAKNK